MVLRRPQGSWPEHPGFLIMHAASHSHRPRSLGTHATLPLALILQDSLILFGTHARCFHSSTVLTRTSGSLLQPHTLHGSKASHHKHPHPVQKHSSSSSYLPGPFLKSLNKKALILLLIIIPFLPCLWACPARKTPNRTRCLALL